MKRSIIDRYEMNDSRQVVVDVSVRSVEDLFDRFDRSAPYLKKDLDPQFVDYLIGCAQDLGCHGFIIRINLATPATAENKQRVQQSIRNYLYYLQQVTVRELKTMFRRSLALFGLGLALLTMAIVAGQQIAHDGSVPGQILTEGLTVAAWVSLWQALANLLIEWHPHRRDLIVYRRIMAAPVQFQ
jgi:hypothetical protein